MPTDTDTPDFTPVRTRARFDGWTAERQRIFLTALAESGCISIACHDAGMTARSAYRLRAHPDGASFARAWDHALRLALPRLATIAVDRAVRGSITEKWVDGRLVSETRAPSDRLLMFLLQRFSPPAPAPDARLTELEEMAANASRGFLQALDGLADSDVQASPLSALDYMPTPIADRAEQSPAPAYEILD